MSEELFTTQMKKATRKLHAVSDALVNAKLVFALNNNAVWADGLLIFYEIFRFLEEAMIKFKDDNLGKLHINGMDRTESFKNDLTYYLGPDWKKQYYIRDSVACYLSHLKHLSDKNPDLLMAYVYHLYMGLLSGGQILRKKQEIQRKIFNDSENIDGAQGRAVTDFGDLKISDLKTELRQAMNDIAETLDENKKQLLIEESKKVFELNNMVIRTIKGTNKILFYNITLILMCIVVALCVYAFVVS